MAILRRYLRSGKTLACVLVGAGVLWSNMQVVPVNKASWMPWFGEPGPPTDREARHGQLPRNLTVHLVPHSHSDIGWNLSFEGYYRASVHRVLRRVSVELWEDAGRRFTWGDLAFLDLWLDDEGDAANGRLAGADAGLTWRQVVVELMRRGQWDVVGGTYVSPDEGLATWWAHNAIVDTGHRTLARQLNATTRVGWQIDNFGHHTTTPHVLGNTGYAWLVLGRMAFRDLYAFASRAALQFVWRSREHPQSPALRTHFLAEHYGLPSAAFDFDYTASCDEQALLKELLRIARRHVGQFPPHGHVLVMMGDDFRFVRAAHAFGCLDRLVAASRHSAQWRDARLQYSTMTEYLSAVEPHVEPHTLREHGGDFYPYQDKPVEQYWAGILASRPYLKWLVRDTEQIVQHAEALVAAQRLRNSTNAWPVLERHLEFCRKQVAIGYHHDAITGTCSEPAFADYARRLRSAARVALRVSHAALHPVANPDRIINLAYKGLDDSLAYNETQTSLAYNETQISLAYNETQASLAYNTATRDAENSARDRLEVIKARCSDAACAGAAIVVSNTLLEAQDVVVRLRVHAGSAVLVDSAGTPVRPVHVQQQAQNAFDVDFVASVPALGTRGYALASQTQYARAPTLGEQAARATKEAVEQFSAELRQGDVRVVVRGERNGVVRISAGGRVVRHQMREYFANPYVQASGAYVMHSFGLMYSFVFWIFGAALASGLALAWAVHVRVKGPKQPSNAGSRALSIGTVFAAAVGAIAGAALVYYAAQVASVDRLNDWTRGRGVVVLAAPVLGSAYVVGRLLRWRRRRACVCVLAAAFGVFLALVLGRTWQSRALTPQRVRFTVEHNNVCSIARAHVSDAVSVEYRLCADSPRLLQVSALVRAPDNREIIARLEHGGGRTLELFDGVSIRRRSSSMWTPVPGTFFPAPLLARLGALSVHVRQPVGVSSLKRGMMDVLVHRSMTANDFRGLKTPLIDKHPAHVTLFVDIGNPKNNADYIERVSARVNTPPLAFVLPPDTDISPYSALHASLPDLSMVGIRAESDHRVDVRLLAHRPVNMDIHDLLRGATSAIRVHGDWTLCNTSAVERSFTPAPRVQLRSGEQALFQVQIGSVR